MSKPKPIQITIHHPCNQSWDEMTPDGQGRHCAHCQKVVIDFSTWSDEAIHSHFSTYKGHTCGRFLSTQLNRPIAIPHQPHSRLYRMTIVLGLTLLFTQTPHLLAQERPPKAAQRPGTDKINQQSRGTQRISGRVLDDRQDVLISATIQVFQAGILKGGAVTDYDGYYTVIPIEAGLYDVTTTYQGYKSDTVRNVRVSDSSATICNFALRPATTPKEVVVTSYKVGLVVHDEPEKKLFTGEMIARLPTTNTDSTAKEMSIPTILWPQNPGKTKMDKKDIDHMPH